ncbi:tRNA pseudouridine(55) synthase TruB [Lactobacillus sp. 3B(2020)]|uniref:tRNA pseudouridine(55) synthase TruB n=1 Tax=Lactobacillus sp. 3B(2020) TaxID=2695882 RepID=UPI0015DF8C36|nr:tRNA pseudouridine(55) synthase TruB [Lactobacillus sp. 3B(2020)]QLL70273.1 tRNA pseudouridine(55) synthase TruB [Lactobacillus sp. 3B(2020)]
MDGIIPLYKERGMTSFDAVSRLRRILHEKKIGHSGTLDPEVAGVLPICVGKATKLVDLLMASGKEYAGELLIGKATETEDLTGKVIEEAPVEAEIERQTIEAAMAKLTGKIIQIPPMYSAVKVNGRRLYEYARAGETVDRPKRQVVINRFELTASTYNRTTKTQRVRFIVDCTKGTYVRTLVVDLAKLLGYPGTMASLTRLKSGGFELDQTLSLDDIQDQMSAQLLNLYPLEYAVRDFPTYELSKQEWQLVKNGGWLKRQIFTDPQAKIAVYYEGRLRALYKLVGENYKPDKMIDLSEEK